MGTIRESRVLAALSCDAITTSPYMALTNEFWWPNMEKGHVIEANNSNFVLTSDLQLSTPTLRSSESLH